MKSLLLTFFLFITLFLLSTCVTTKSQSISPKTIDNKTVTLFSFRQNELYGYANEKSEVVIQPQFPFAWNFSEGLARVISCIDGRLRVGFIDVKGNSIIKAQFSDAADFTNGFASIEVNKKWGFINKMGEIVVQPQFDKSIIDEYKFSEDLAAVKVKKKWGFIDTKGDFVLEPKFEGVENFSEGLAMFEVKDKCGFIDKTGKIVIKSQFDMCADGFKEGFARVNMGYRSGWSDEDSNGKIRKWGVIDKGKWGLIDKTGKFVLRPKFYFLDDFTEGLAQACNNDKCGFLDKSFKFVIPAKFDDVRNFSEELAAVQINDKWGYIDKNGRFIIQPQFDEAYDFRGGIAAVNSGASYIDKIGNYIWNDKEKDNQKVFIITPKNPCQ